MNSKFAIAAAALIYALGGQAAVAQPMKCSGERKTCISVCEKSLNPSLAPRCIANCHASHSFCIKTGCWDSGNGQYCGLTKQ